MYVILISDKKPRRQFVVRSSSQVFAEIPSLIVFFSNNGIVSGLSPAQVKTFSLVPSPLKNRVSISIKSIVDNCFQFIYMAFWRAWPFTTKWVPSMKYDTDVNWIMMMIFGREEWISSWLVSSCTTWPPLLFGAWVEIETHLLPPSQI